MQIKRLKQAHTGCEKHIKQRPPLSISLDEHKPLLLLNDIQRLKNISRICLHIGMSPTDILPFTFFQTL